MRATAAVGQAGEVARDGGPDGWAGPAPEGVAATRRPDRITRSGACRGLPAASSFFTEDASLSFVDRGERIETRARILERFVGQFGDQSPDLRHTTRIETVQTLTDHVVAIDGEVLIERLAPDARGARTPVRRFAITGVMLRDSTGWRIGVLRAFQT